MRSRFSKYRPGITVFMFAVAVVCGVRAQGTGSPGNTDTLESGPSQDQKPQIETRFIPDSVGIGDLFELEVDITKDVMQMIAFPEFDNNMLADVIEIAEEGPVDTLSHEGRNVTLRRKYKLQSFEEGYYGLGLFPMLYAEKNVVDTIWSRDTMKIMIGTFAIDTATQTIYDIKPPLGASVKFGEISMYLLWGVLGLLAIGVLIWYLYTRRRHLSLLGKPKPVEPPHVTAIRALENIHNQKLWQNNKHKLYYTAISDILREYIDGRYSVRAMEMTTDEIMETLADRGLEVKNYRDLKEILENSDLVKFAKFVPEADYNELVYTDAYYFVENTKPDEVEPGKADELNIKRD